MTRREVLQEGIQLPHGPIVDEGAAHCEDVTLPVLYGSVGGEVIGKATGFIRSEDNALSFEVEHPPWLTLHVDDCDWSIYCTDVVSTKDLETEVTTITSCRIRAVVATIPSGFPKGV